MGAWVNAALFNVSWLAIVTGGSAWSGMLVVACHLAIHGRWFVEGPGEWWFVAVVTLVGVVSDQVVFQLGILVREGAVFAPFWLSCLWPVFASTPLHCFRWLLDRPWLSAALGGIGGMASYSAGVALSEIDFGRPAAGPWIIGLIWMVMFPLMLRLARRFVADRQGFADEI